MAVNNCIDLGLDLDSDSTDSEGDFDKYDARRKKLKEEKLVTHFPEASEQSKEKKEESL